MAEPLEVPLDGVQVAATVSGNFEGDDVGIFVLTKVVPYWQMVGRDR